MLSNDNENKWSKTSWAFVLWYKEQSRSWSSLQLRAPRGNSLSLFSKQIKGLIKIGTQNPKAVFLCHKSEKDIRGHHIMLKIWAQDSRTVFYELILAFDSSSYKVSKFIKTYKLSLLGLDSKCLKYYKIQFIERKVCYTSKFSIITPGMLHQSYLWIKIE